jgi:prepilin signal peptidase PulO-like enzyme (type II secretory pathway)
MEASTASVPTPTTTTTTEPGRSFADLLPSGRARILAGFAAAALLAASFVVFGASGRAFVGAVLCPVLVVLAAIDVKHRVLPNAIVLPGVLLIGLIVAAADAGGFLEHLWAALALGFFLFFFAAFFPSGLGMGDAKVGFLIGLALGSRTLSAMMVAFFGVFVAALWVLTRKGLSARKQTLPFGPFLALGGIAAFFLT